MSEGTPIEPEIFSKTDGKLAATTLAKLAKAGITTMEQLAYSTPKEIIDLTGIGKETAEKAVSLAQRIISPGFITADELHKKLDKLAKCSTGSKHLDRILGGGISMGLITELTSEYAGGKTQTCFTLSVIAPLPREQGGLNGKVVFIDSVLKDEPILIQENGTIALKKISDFIDPYFHNNQEGSVTINSVLTPSIDSEGNIMWMPINRVYRHTNNEKKYKITTSNGLYINVTEGHSLLTYKDGVIQKTETKDLKMGDYIPIPRKIPYKKLSYITSIDVAKLLRDCGEKGIYDTNDASICRINTHTFKRFINIDSELIIFLAWYLSDGHIKWKQGKGFTVLTLNKKRGKKAIDATINIAKRIERSYHITDRGTNIQITIPSKILALTLEHLFGTGAPKKHLHPIIFNLPPHLIKLFIDEWIDGDYGSTTSKELASDINYLALLIGRRFSQYLLKRKNKQFTIDERTITANYDIIQVISTKNYRTGIGVSPKYSKYVTLNDCLMLPIKNIEELEPTSEYVYDLCIDKTNTFIAGHGGISTHNTEGTFEKGGTDRLIQIAKARGIDPDEALKNIIWARAYNAVHQETLIANLDGVCREHNVKLVIIDSMLAHLRSEYLGRGVLAERQALLAKMLGKLLRLSGANNVAVVITNQVQAKVDGSGMYGDPNQAAGGHVMAHAATIRVRYWKGRANTRLVAVVDSSYLPEEKVRIEINEAGITDEGALQNGS